MSSSEEPRKAPAYYDKAVGKMDFAAVKSYFEDHEVEERFPDGYREEELCDELVELLCEGEKVLRTDHLP